MMELSRVICDHCGVLTSGLDGVFVVVKGNSIPHINKDYDLCPACAKALDEFMSANANVCFDTALRQGLDKPVGK